jgi:hypothetical protein
VGSPAEAAPLLHSMDGTRANERPDVGREGGLGARWEAHEPDMLSGDRDAWEAQL